MFTYIIPSYLLVGMLMVLDAVMPRIHGTSGLSALVSGFKV